MDRRPQLALRIAMLAISLGMIINPVVLAQQGAPAAAPAADSAPPANLLTQQDMDELMAPIALYPDALLAQILMASTYPLEVVEAARWSKANPNVKDKALEDAMQQQDWDPSVKALTSVPQVLTMMNEKLDWTRKLGDAFLAQQEDLLATAQTLRKKAEAAGNLKSSKELTVTQATEDNVQIIKIEQPNPQVIYVPTYNPAVVYGPWWYPVPPPYYYYPPGYIAAPGFWFATGVVVGAAIWGNVGWGHHSSVNININNYNRYNRTTINNNNWNHNAQHRQGVPYRDQNTASKYNQGGAQARNAQSRDQFRGREQGASASNRAAGSGSMGDRGGASASQRASGSGGLGSSSSGSRAGSGASASTRQASGGFSGAGGGGASARASSSRGGASRGGGGGGGRR